MEDPFAPECSQLISPREAEAKMRESLPPTVMNFTSDDYVEYTWHAPTARFYIGRPMLNAPDIKPPIRFPWPEYISTAQGEDWWIPTTDEDQ